MRREEHYSDDWGNSVRGCNRTHAVPVSWIILTTLMIIQGIVCWLHVLLKD